MQNLHRETNQDAVRRLQVVNAAGKTRPAALRDAKRPEPAGLSRAELRKIVIDLIG